MKRSKIFSLSSVFLIGMLFLGVAWYVRAIGSGKRYGPITCSACSLGSPQADAATVVFISVWERKVAQTPMFWTQMIVHPGDVVIVCNARACVPYTKTDSGQYMGGTADPQRSSPPRSAAGRRGRGGVRGGGSVGTGPGCVGKCTGTVTVGKARKR